MPHSQIFSVFPSRFRYFTKCSLDRGSSLSISRVVEDEEGPSATGCGYTTTFSPGALTLCSKICKSGYSGFSQKCTERGEGGGGGRKRGGEFNSQNITAILPPRDDRAVYTRRERQNEKRKRPGIREPFEKRAYTQMKFFGIRKRGQARDKRSTCRPA